MATAMAEPPPFPLPPILHHASPPPTLITQGAEARLYLTTHLTPNRPSALKYRPPKPWRHPTLDARLTRARILAEARVLHKCHREGVPVPAVLALDDVAGWLMLEWIGGNPVRVAINTWLEKHHPIRAAAGAGQRKLEKISEEEQGELQDATEPVVDEAQREKMRGDEALKALLRRAGASVGKLHKIGIVHGDLTTSNMMLRPTRMTTTTPGAEAGAGAGKQAESGDSDVGGDVVLIDFGLATTSTAEEDRAVDLYVLERAFGSTHPRAEVLFPEVLEGYKEALPAKQSGPVLRKLEDVRMRGRKRSMVG